MEEENVAKLWMFTSENKSWKSGIHLLNRKVTVPFGADNLQPRTTRMYSKD